MGYVLLQLWMMIYIHPLTLAIAPTIMIIYGIRLENKRVRLRYGLDKPKRISASHTLGSAPEPIGEFEWKVEKAVEQYERLLEEDDSESAEN